MVGCQETKSCVGHDAAADEQARARGEIAVGVPEGHFGRSGVGGLESKFQEVGVLLFRSDLLGDLGSVKADVLVIVFCDRLG